MNLPKWDDVKQLWKDASRGVRVTLGSILVFIGAMAAYQLVPAQLDVPNHIVLPTGNWRLLACTTITVDNVSMIIAPGFDQWDGLSIPASVTNRLQITRYDYPEASLWHDTGYAILDKRGNGPLSKSFVDEGLRKLLVRAGCVPVKAQAVQDAVDAWGFVALQRHTPESVERARRFVSIYKRLR